MKVGITHVVCIAVIVDSQLSVFGRIWTLYAFLLLGFMNEKLFLEKPVLLMELTAMLSWCPIVLRDYRGHVLPHGH
jgi:hypothetical protein